MNGIQKLLFAVVIVMSCGINSASAQIYVSIRPARPVYVRTVAPSPEYVWVDEEWNGVGDRYEWRGGYWAAPPHQGYRYSQGYWRHSSRGDNWTPGRWNSGNGNNGYRRGNDHHGNNGHHGGYGHHDNDGHHGENGHHGDNGHRK